MVFHLDTSGRHYLPILPRGDPKAARPPPLHSVMDLKDPKAAPATPSSKSGGSKDLKDPKAPMPSPKSQEDPQSSRTKRHLLFPGSGSDGDHPLMAPRHLPPGPSSPKPRGISSSSSVKRLVINLSPINYSVRIYERSVTKSVHLKTHLIKWIPIGPLFFQEPNIPCQTT